MSNSGATAAEGEEVKGKAELESTTATSVAASEGTPTCIKRRKKKKKKEVVVVEADAGVLETAAVVEEKPKSKEAEQEVITTAVSASENTLKCQKKKKKKKKKKKANEMGMAENEPTATVLASEGTPKCKRKKEKAKEMMVSEGEVTATVLASEGTPKFDEEDKAKEMRVAEEPTAAVLALEGIPKCKRNAETMKEALMTEQEHTAAVSASEGTPKRRKRLKKKIKMQEQQDSPQALLGVVAVDKIVASKSQNGCADGEGVSGDADVSMHPMNGEDPNFHEDKDNEEKMESKAGEGSKNCSINGSSLQESSVDIKRPRKRQRRREKQGSSIGPNLFPQDGDRVAKDNVDGEDPNFPEGKDDGEKMESKAGEENKNCSDNCSSLQESSVDINRPRKKPRRKRKQDSSIGPVFSPQDGDRVAKDSLDGEDPNLPEGKDDGEKMESKAVEGNTNCSVNGSSLQESAVDIKRPRKKQRSKKKQRLSIGPDFSLQDGDRVAKDSLDGEDPNFPEGKDDGEKMESKGGEENKNCSDNCSSLQESSVDIKRPRKKARRKGKQDSSIGPVFSPQDGDRVAKNSLDCEDPNLPEGKDDEEKIESKAGEENKNCSDNCSSLQECSVNIKRPRKKPKKKRKKDSSSECSVFCLQDGDRVAKDSLNGEEPNFPEGKDDEEKMESKAGEGNKNCSVNGSSLQESSVDIKRPRKRPMRKVKQGSPCEGPSFSPQDGDMVAKDSLHSSTNHGLSCICASCLVQAHREQVKDVYSPRGSLIRFRRKKLLILDLNGLLGDINQDFQNAHLAHAKVRGKLVFRRPYSDDFLRFCFQNFEVGIWSSRKKENVDSVVNILMSDLKQYLLFCWDMSHCTVTGSNTVTNKHKPLVLKELKKLWNKEGPNLPWEQGDFSPSNTLLVDDSPYKALCNPPHTAIFPHPYSYLDQRHDCSLGPGGDLRLYLERLAAADDVQVFVRDNPFGQPSITESDPHWNFYLRIVNKVEKSKGHCNKGPAKAPKAGCPRRNHVYL